jgi:hypothetical protein
MPVHLFAQQCRWLTDREVCQQLYRQRFCRKSTVWGAHECRLAAYAVDGQQKGEFATA